MASIVSTMSLPPNEFNDFGRLNYIHVRNVVPLKDSNAYFDDANLALDLHNDVLVVAELAHGWLGYLGYRLLKSKRGTRDANATTTFKRSEENAVWEIGGAAASSRQIRASNYQLRRKEMAIALTSSLGCYLGSVRPKRSSVEQYLVGCGLLNGCISRLWLRPQYSFNDGDCTVLTGCFILAKGIRS